MSPRRNNRVIIEYSMNMRKIYIYFAFNMKMTNKDRAYHCELKPKSKTIIEIKVLEIGKNSKRKNIK